MYIVLILLIFLYSQTQGAAEQIIVQISSKPFPFKLGEDHFDANIEVKSHEKLFTKYKEWLPKKEEPATTSEHHSQNKQLLFIAQKLYMAVQEDDSVQKCFFKAVEASEYGEALWEWQQACFTINKTLNQKMKMFKKITSNIAKSDPEQLNIHELEQIYFLVHFAFQQSKYTIEKNSSKHNHQTHIPRWFVVHDYKKRL